MMLRITVDLLPFGAPPAHTLGIVEIVNTGAGTPEVGEYEVTASVHDTTGRPRMKRYSATVTDWPRQDRNALHLLRAALDAMLGDDE